MDRRPDSTVLLPRQHIYRPDAVTRQCIRLFLHHQADQAYRSALSGLIDHIPGYTNGAGLTVPETAPDNCHGAAVCVQSLTRPKAEPAWLPLSYQRTMDRRRWRMSLIRYPMYFAICKKYFDAINICFRVAPSQFWFMSTIIKKMNTARLLREKSERSARKAQQCRI